MERNFKSDFERFLKESADQYKMYPSDKVWKGVNNSLHNRKKWYGLGLLLLLLTGGFITTLFVRGPKTETVVSQNSNTVTPSVESTSAEQKQKAIVKNITDAPNYKPAVKSGNNILPGILSSDNNMFASEDNGSQNIETENTATPNESMNSLALVNETNNVATTENKTTFTSSPLDEYVPHSNTQKDVAAVNENKPSLKPNSILQNPYTIESVVNSFSKNKPSFTSRRRVELQLSFTPTISYRKLTANKNFLRNATAQSTPYNYAAIYNSVSNVKNVVTHKPDMGLELGLTAKYAVHHNIKIKAGMQFNINRYDIKAFYHPYDVATIALNSGVRIDSLKTIAEYRNIGSSSQSNWLQNYYFQVSMPVGVEVLFGKNKNVRFGMAGTIQPTLLLSERAYLLSTDYKNYTEVSWLTRRWNANTAFETFVAYSTGKLNWQIGPQVRYQLKSSFIDKYPVKENLFDFGLKVGVTLNK